MKKRKITDNIPLKIMSVAVAVVVWLIVVNIDNPVGTNYYTLNNVELINKEYVESSDTIGKMCMPEQSHHNNKEDQRPDQSYGYFCSSGSAAGSKSGHESCYGSDHSDLFYTWCISK